MPILTDTIRDPRSGTVHKMGEKVTVTNEVKDALRGTVYSILWQDGTRGVVLLKDIDGIE